MKLTTCCIVTKNVKDLSDFYQRVLQLEPQAYGEDYVEFETGEADLSIFSLEAHEKLAPGSVELPGKARGGVLLEFMVDDVEEEYKRLQGLDIEFIKGLTTQPWGNRSFYFRDPDGNFINFYSRV